jgi:hypothetical protein
MDDMPSPGYVRTIPVRVMKFDETTEFPGLVIRVRAMTMHQIMTMMVDIEQAAETSMRVIISRFADHVIGWNVLTEDGTPVPATADGVMGLDAEFVTSVVMEWLSQTTGAIRGGSPLDATSQNGELPAAKAPDLQMESL